VQGKIKDIKAIKVYDSLGKETIKVIAFGENYMGSYIVDSSNQKSGRINLTPDMAIERIEKVVKPALIDLNYFDQGLIDNLLLELDNTKNYSYLGANVILAVSLAISSLASNESNFFLFRYLSSLNSTIMPIPIVTALSGNDFDFIKEYLLIPKGFNDIKESIEKTKKIIDKLTKKIYENNSEVFCDEQGNVLSIPYKIEENISLINNVIKEEKCEDHFFLGIRTNNNAYNYEQSRYLIDNHYLTSKELIDFYLKICNMNVKYFENPFNFDDKVAYESFNEQKGKDIIICSDDSNIVDFKYFNSTLIKLNDCINLTDVIKRCNLLKMNNILPISSSFYSETEDSLTIDLCVALNIPFIRCGSLSRAEKISKINRLLNIKDLIGNDDYFNNYLKLYPFFKE